MIIKYIYTESKVDNKGTESLVESVHTEVVSRGKTPSKKTTKYLTNEEKYDIVLSI